MKNNPIGWFEIYVQDIDRARNFYESVFQIKLEKLHTPDVEMWAFPMDMTLYGAGGSIVKMAGCPSGGNSTLVYFSCANCAVEEGRVAQAGGRVDKAKMSIGQYGFISLVLDSEGNRLGLHSME